MIRRARRRRKKRGAFPSVRFLLPLVRLGRLPALMIASFLSVLAFAKPVVVEEQVPRRTVKQAVEFEHYAFARNCSLYSAGQRLSRGVYFTNIIASLAVRVRVTAAVVPETPAAGTARVLLRLQAEDLWEKSYVLEQGQEFALEAGVGTVLDKVYFLPLREVMDFVGAVTEEIGVAPAKGYSLVVQPVIHLATLDEAAPPTTFEPQFSFLLRSSLLVVEPHPETAFRDEKVFKVGVQRANYLNLPGCAVPVMHGRILFPLCGAAFLVSTAAGMFKEHGELRRIKRDDKAGCLERRCRRRLVRVSPDGLTLGRGHTVKVERFGDLLRIADEGDCQLLAVGSSPAAPGYYCVLDRGVAFIYEPWGGAPGDARPHS